MTVTLPINRFYYALVSALRCWLVVIAFLALIHFFAPDNSMAGRILADTVQAPWFVIVLLVATPLVALLYFHRLASTFVLSSEDQLSLSKGSLFHQCVRLKRQRISHSEVQQSMFERALGLVTVKIYTPGTKAPTMVLPNIRESFAAHLPRLGIDV